ncbi:MAG: hypothetical protein B7Z53_01410 [Rhodospirillales bacterium 12-71-4]|nr:MAG: hypothetical protein B7Z53_01410 [Rhodospirillales bacterium 12-71-4]
MSQPISLRVAAWSVGLRPEAVPPSVAAAIRLRILDLVGVMLATRAEPMAQAARRAAVAADPGAGAQILGETEEVSPMAAAFVNGVLTAVLEFDDTHIESFIHPTAPVLAAVLAELPRRRPDGAALLTAVLAGMELTCRLGLVPPVRLHTLGFHPTAVFGIFGATLALARLRGLDAATTADALGHAGSLSAGLNAAFEDGSATKMMHVGMAATGALRAVALAEAGLSGPRPVFEGRFGWFRSHVQGEPDLRLDRIGAGLGEEWAVLDIAAKVHPCAFTMMPHIEATLALRAAHGIRPADVAGILCLIGRRSFATMCEPVADKRRPATSWHGRISLQHTVAEALVRGRMDKGAYAEDALRDPQVNALADLVTYEDDPATVPTRSGGEVRITLRDGRVLAHRIEDMRGTRANPMTEADVLAKFRANAGDLMPAAALETTIAALLGLGGAADAAAVFAGIGRGVGGHVLPEPATG